MTATRKTPTMADVARIAGVSPMTVSRAFRQDSSVSETTRAQIREVAETLGYVFDSTASNLRSQRTDFIAVIIPSINNANFAETVKGLSEGLKPRGLQILLGYTDYDPREEERLIEQLLRRRPEAMVVTGGTHSERSRRLLAGAGIPIVETWELPTDPIGHVVGFSNAEAVKHMVTHLLARGLDRIAFIGGDDSRDSRGADRRAGFVTAMLRHGKDPSRLIPTGMPPVSMREGAQAMANLLTTLPDTDAVICVSDLVAFGALTECQRRGISVPRDISIAGFGAYEIGALCVPSLSTIDPFPREIGSRTAELIIALRDGRMTQPARVALAPRLLLRDSSL